MVQKYDTIIVGGGIAGLVAGNYLAREGDRVLLIEKNTFVGGYCSSFKDGSLLFDGAATMISGLGSKEGYAQRAFRKIGISCEADLIPLETFEKIVLGDEEFIIPADFDEFIGMLKKRFPEEQDGLDQFLDLVETIFVEMEKINSWEEPILTNFQQFPKVYPVIFKEKNTDLEEVLSRFFTNEQLKNFLRAQCYRLGLIPQTTSLINYVGCWYYTYKMAPAYLKGGVGRLANLLAGGIIAKGGTVLTGQKCSKILVEDGRALGVELENGQRYLADNVVSNADATKTLFELVGAEHFKKSFVKKIERMVLSPSAFILYLSIRGDLSEYNLGSGDVWFFEEEAFNKELSVEEQSFNWNRLYFSSPGIKDPTGKGNGQISLMIIKTTPFHNPEYWDIHAEEYSEQILNYAERFLPELKEKIVKINYSTPIDLAETTGNTQGSVVGWAPIPSQSGFLRLPRDTPIENLYLTGHWTGPGSGVLTVIVSGMKVGQMIVTRDAQ